MCTSRINSTTGKTIRKVISGNGFLDPTLPRNSDEASTPTSTPSATSNTCHQTREKNNGEALSILPRYSFQLILRLPSQRNHGSYTPLPSPITRSRPNRFSTKSGKKKPCLHETRSNFMIMEVVTCSYHRKRGSSVPSRKPTSRNPGTRIPWRYPPAYLPVSAESWQPTPDEPLPATWPSCP